MGAFNIVPSILCQRQAIPSKSSYSAKPARHSASNTPAACHSRNRLWIALAEPKRSRGRAFHWHPVRNTYTMPSNTRRGSFRLRPAPCLRWYFLSAGRSGGVGINGSTRSQNESDTSHAATFVLATGSLRPALARDGETEYYTIYG